jgi:hypothetical protein
VIEAQEPELQNRLKVGDFCGQELTKDGFDGHLLSPLL